MVKVGYDPLPADKAFVEHRVDFIKMNLVTFNELKEARELRRKLLEQQAKEPGEKGDERRLTSCGTIKRSRIV